MILEYGIPVRAEDEHLAANRKQPQKQLLRFPDEHLPFL